MSLAPVTALTSTSLKSWFSTKGFVLVALAALLPVALTGAWAATNQADVEATEVTWDRDVLVAGENVTFTAVYENVGSRHVGAFNASLSVGNVVGAQFHPIATETTRIDALAPGESATFTLTWTPRAGGYHVLAFADQEDEVGEVDEINNQLAEPIAVNPRTPDEANRPVPPAGIAGNADANRTTDLVVVDVTRGPAEPRQGDNVTVNATFRNDGPDAVENALVFLRIGPSQEGELMPVIEESDAFALEPGETVELSATWPRTQSGAYWVEAYVQAPGDAHDPDAEDNHRAEPFTVAANQPRSFPAPPEEMTIKMFYVDVLQYLHLLILIPFIALFYAGGVVTDERTRGTLPYILTRPLPRWLIPLAKFAAGFVVAATAIGGGIVLAYLILLGYPGAGDAGFLTTPLIMSLLALFTYGAFFTFLGVVSDRPYLVGVGFVLGWETIAGFLLPWVSHLTIRHHVTTALGVWPLDQGASFLPPESEGVRAMGILLAAGVAFLAAAAVAMKRREFHV